ncbi:MAG: glycosyltransferase [Deltaproteobacteria bacterium]|nr:glycosyltransferase [Deltaproteobacteria bacterium]
MSPPPTFNEYKSIEDSPNFIKRDPFNNRPIDITDPLVSIITISFNSERTILKTISSVTKQTYKNIQYIIIDGGSSDKTVEIIKNYQKNISIILTEKDKGISDAFNKGLYLSKGKLIGIINSDDWYENDAVEQVVNHWKEFGDGIFHGKLQYWENENVPYYIFSGRDDKLLNGMTINHPTTFVSKKTYDKIGLFNLDLRRAMDYDFLLRAKLSGEKFYYIDKVISNMLLGGVSDSAWPNTYFEVFKIRNFHGLSKTKNGLILATSVLKTIVRILLESIGLHTPVSFFRRYFSMVPKSDPRERT